MKSFGPNRVSGYTAAVFIHQIGISSQPDLHFLIEPDKDALVKTAHFEELVASRLASLADDLEKQGYLALADVIQQACHRHRAACIKSGAIAAGLEE
jgi:hypothetical protein